MPAQAQATLSSVPEAASLETAAKPVGPVGDALVSQAKVTSAQASVPHVTGQKFYPAGSTVVTHARSGEGVIRITYRICGNANGWQTIAARNNITPQSGYLVLYNQAVTVTCGLPAVTTQAPAAAPQQQSAPRSTSTGVGSGSWVRPLDGSWCFTPNGSREFGVQRPGHKHGGLDLGAPVGAYSGDPIYAMHSGIAHHGYQASGAGVYVWVDHQDGTSSWYFHMSARNVADGAHVSAGQVIGFVGATGDAIGAHLHWETHIGGTRVDPVAFFRDRTGVDIRC